MLSLHHYRMLDLCRMFPGPFASHNLADLGMEVIKVEEPEPRYGVGRDPLTPANPTAEDEVRTAAYNIVARNKKSIALDLLDPKKRSASQQVFYRLVQQADIILDGYRPGVLQWMGVDYETVKAYNPKIIYCALTGYGQDGPYAKRPAHGGQMNAVGGVTPLGRDGRPLTLPVPLGDVVGALYATTCILGALLHRDATGEGQYLDVSLTAAAMATMVMPASHHVQREEDPPPRAAEASLSNIKCKDGKWISTGNSENIFWENFCNVLGRPEWIPLHRRHGPEVDRMNQEIEKIFLTKTRDEWLDILVKAETCVAPVNHIGEALEDPQMRHVGMTWEMQHPTLGPIKQLGFPVRFSGSALQPGEFAPVLGQHTREILGGAGYTEAEIAGLERDGIVKSWEQASMKPGRA